MERGSINRFLLCDVTIPSLGRYHLVLEEGRALDLVHQGDVRWSLDPQVSFDRTLSSYTLVIDLYSGRHSRGLNTFIPFRSTYQSAFA